MMLKSNTVTESTFDGSIVAQGVSYELMDQNTDISWSTSSDDFPRVENTNIESPGENNCDEIMEVRTAHWAIVEEEPEEPTNGFAKDEEVTTDEVTRPVQDSFKLDPVPIKTEKNDLEWKIEQSTKVVSTTERPRKFYYPSITERELREAQALCDNNDSLLSPSGRCSRGAQLFNRRRQRIKAFEEQKLARLAGTQNTIQVQSKQVQHGVTLTKSKDTEFNFDLGRPSHFHSMEETSPDSGNTGEKDDLWGVDAKETEFLPIDRRAPSPSASEEDHQEPLSAYLKEKLMVSNTNTNGLVLQTSQKIESPIMKEQNGTQSTQYSEVHLTLSKPIAVSNRTAKPFGGQSVAKRIETSSEKSPIIELPPPPTYAETLSSPPPVSRVRSPPMYSTLYPTESAPITPVNQVANYGEARHTVQPKTGILESMALRRGPKKSMFTFIEKPKLAPNPELLTMVQNADVKKKQKEHGDVSAEEESFALGAEASNFQNKPSHAENITGHADKILDWSSSLKSPGVTARPPPMPVQTLSEDKGKGAQLFARRQSRMERFVVASPTPQDSVRSPSPAMSLPPSWKFVANAKTPPRSFNHQAHNNQRSPKPAYVAPVNNTASELSQSERELEISKRQPYQLQSSLFILSPTKDPLSTLPKAAPPPKPMVLESYRLTRQSSCPTSPLVPSPSIYSPTYTQSIRSPSSAVSPSPVSNTPLTYGRMTPTSQVSPMSPVPFTNAQGSSPRNKTVVQAPRPTFSARNSGLESQKFREFIPGPTSNRSLRHQGSLDGWGSSSVSSPGYDDGSVILSPPLPRSMSPAWSERSQSPSPFRMQNDPNSGKQMKALIARNIINAAKRKSTSPWGVTSPQSPIHINSPWSSTVRNGSSLPATPRGRRSPTGSDISIESEDSGAKSPGFRSYPFSPRGWYGSMRAKRDSLPSSSPFTYTP